MNRLLCLNLTLAAGLLFVSPALAVKNVQHVGTGAMDACQVLADNGQGTYEDDGEIQTCCSTIGGKTECVICRNNDNCVGYEPRLVIKSVALRALLKARKR